jgi:hypothetical protein
MVSQMEERQIPNFILDHQLITKAAKDVVLDLFSRSFNLQSEDDYISLITWMVKRFFPKGGYPILTILGDTGTGKTTVGRFIVDLLDPSVTPVMTLPKSPDDLYACAKNRTVLMFDHLSRISPNMSDALCHLSTTNPVILTSMHDILRRKDLLRTKSVIIRTKRPDNYVSQRTLERTFREYTPHYCSYLTRCLRKLREENVIKSYSDFGEFRKWMQNHVLFSLDCHFPLICPRLIFPYEPKNGLKIEI